MQWFLSESGWDQQELNGRRLELLFEDPATAPDGEGVLVIDEHGDRKWGKRTAHVGKQWLANMGKTENGVVSVSSVWADEGVYYPLEVEPYTPKHHFEGGTSDPRFRTKLKIAQQLVERSADDPEGDLPASSWPTRKERKGALVGVLAGGVEGGEGVAGTVGDAVALLEGVLRSAPAEGAKSAA